LCALYGLDIRNELASADVPEVPDETGREEILRGFAETLVRGVTAHLAFLDALISKCSMNWKMDRMMCLDRNILRLAAFEMSFLPEIPHIVSINEAIEISKEYGSEESPKFINGVLNRVKDELDAEQQAPPSQ